MIPSSISALYYKWGAGFYGFMLFVAFVLLLLAYINDSYLLAFAGVSAPAVASYGDFKGTDDKAHYLQAAFVFIPILLFSGPWWILYGAGAALPGALLGGKNKIFWAEIGIIVTAIIGMIL